MSLSPSQCPIIGNSTIMAISNRNVADIAYAISLSSASMTGAIAAIAEPPQIPVPAEMRLDSSQLSPRAFPMKYPPPKHVRSVNIITERDIFPTVSMVFTLSEAPSRIMANLRIFFEVNFSPSCSMSGFQNEFIVIPMNSAITEAPTRCIGISPSMYLAHKAISAATANPGIIFDFDLMSSISNFLLHNLIVFYIPDKSSMFILYRINDKIK